MIGTTRQKPKILAAHRYIFSVNALNHAPVFRGNSPAEHKTGLNRVL
jgi:hypothetical protein